MKIAYNADGRLRAGEDAQRTARADVTTTDLECAEDTAAAGTDSERVEVEARLMDEAVQDLGGEASLGTTE